MTKGSVIVKAADIDDNDRPLLQLWSGMALPPTGDIRLNLTRQQFQSLQVLIEMLGGKKAPPT